MTNFRTRTHIFGMSSVLALAGLMVALSPYVDAFPMVSTAGGLVLGMAVATCLHLHRHPLGPEDIARIKHESDMNARISNLERSFELHVQPLPRAPLGPRRKLDA